MIQPRDWMNTQMVMVSTCQKPTRRSRTGEALEVCRGPQRARYVCKEASRTWETRGTPGAHAQGRGAQPNEERRDGSTGVRSTDSTRRTGKPATWGSGGRGFVARKGNRSRTCRTGDRPANLTAGNSQRQAHAPQRSIALGGCGSENPRGARCGKIARRDL